MNIEHRTSNIEHRITPRREMDVFYLFYTEGLSHTPRKRWRCGSEIPFNIHLVFGTLG
jgi:hypothetical protein